MTHARHILIGDVHGCLTELQALIHRLVPQPDDTFVFLGDLIDKGPESPGVVRWVRHFAEAHHVVLVEGNHEEKHRRWRHHMQKGSPTANTMTGIERMAALTQALSAADIAFLDSARLYYPIPAYQVLAVHAGVPPTIESLPSDPREIAAYPRKRRDLYLYANAADSFCLARGQNPSSWRRNRRRSLLGNVLRWPLRHGVLRASGVYNPRPGGF
ncbi:hypothetical protein C2W62_24230 [Candidatus Entotheonella serta]|nr:hypothetical protein C2W62_24230 [Candidatus Entotheonella serta]